MHLKDVRHGRRIAPLTRLTVDGADGAALTVHDGEGRAYASVPAGAEPVFTVGGAPGTHTVRRADGVGGSLTFRVEARTRIADTGGRYADLLDHLHYALIYEFGAYNAVRLHGRTYTNYVIWLRDHVHALKGMKYFSADRLEDCLDLYKAGQREDGMIWDNTYRQETPPNTWEARFAKGGFIRPFEDGEGMWEWKRIPVEADVEYLFVEGVHATWQATGDDDWMAGMLDAGLRALQYSVTDPYRWSTKYELVKRGFTIDTWDYQATGWGTDSDLMPDDAMVIDPATTRFGVMHGDNTGHIDACRRLAGMLRHVGREEEAAGLEERATRMAERLEKVSWNGRFYRHHVPEDTEYPRDFGVDEEAQLSLSNAYSLNRGIPAEHARGIVDSYAALREELPPGSPGEWYGIYPPFEKGFGGHQEKWQYVNGGVFPMVAGELARGAFAHGREAYGADILTRVHELARKHKRLYACYTGADFGPPERELTPLDLTPYAGCDLRSEAEGESFDREEGVSAFPGGGGNDLRNLPTGDHTYAGIPFTVADPASRGGRGCVAVSASSGGAGHVEIPLGRAVGSLYFLHTALNVGGGGVAGLATLHYADGTRHETYIRPGDNVGGFWAPEAPRGDQKFNPRNADAWRGENAVFNNVGVTVHGMDNPHPDKHVDRLVLDAAAGSAVWTVAGLTVSDAPVYLPVDPVSTGLPINWSNATVLAALLEGLAGVKDDGARMDPPTVSPRWAAAGVDDVEATVAYPASGGYVAYRYAHDAAARRVRLEVTGSAAAGSCRLLLPQEAAGELAEVTVTGPGGAVTTRVEAVDGSRYAVFELPTLAPARYELSYAAKGTTA